MVFDEKDMVSFKEAEKIAKKEKKLGIEEVFVDESLIEDEDEKTS